MTFIFKIEEEKCDKLIIGGDKNENIELVVGDATDMFPDGGVSGISSGFGHHENQYIWQSVVYDGKLYLGTFDSSSLLEPIGQFTNGDLINREPEEWQSQIAYIKVLLELLAQKNDSGSNFKLMRESNSQEKAYAMVEEAIELANDRYKNMAISPYSQNKKSSQNSIALSNEQKEQLANDILNGTIATDSLEAKTAEDLAVLNAKLALCDDYLNKNGSEEFINIYEELYQIYKTIEDKISGLPNILDELYDKLLNMMTLDNLKAFKECLEYLSTATRGFDMYVTDDGTNFETITTDGFNDPYNHGLRIFATSDDWMVVGTANPFYGTQLWRMKGEGRNSDSINPNDPANSIKPGTPDRVAMSDDSKKSPDTVNTGDYQNIALWIMAVVTLGTTAAYIHGKKKKSLN